jgi:hypothetical protein
MHFSGVLVATLVPLRKGCFLLHWKERFMYFSEERFAWLLGKNVCGTSRKRERFAYFLEKSVLRVLLGKERFACMEEAFARTIGKAVLAIQKCQIENMKLVNLLHYCYHELYG